jgi:hypothetical protein
MATIGKLTNVPSPGAPITSPWAVDVSKLGIHTFTSKANLTAQWADAPLGATAYVTSENRYYVCTSISPVVWTRQQDPISTTRAVRPTLAAADEGQLLYETDNNRLVAWSGTKWVPVGVVVATAATRPTGLTADDIGQVAFETDTLRTVRWNGSSWLYADTWGNSAATINEAYSTAGMNAAIEFRGGTHVGAGATTDANGDLVINLPAQGPLRVMTATACSGEVNNPAITCTVNSNLQGKINVRCKNSSGAVHANQSVRINWLAIVY